MSSVITLRLGRRFESAELRLRLPATPDEIMEEDGVRETAHGYVRRLSEPFPDLGFEQTM